MTSDKNFSFDDTIMPKEAQIPVGFGLLNFFGVW